MKNGFIAEQFGLYKHCFVSTFVRFLLCFNKIKNNNTNCIRRCDDKSHSVLGKRTFIEIGLPTKLEVISFAVNLKS